MDPERVLHEGMETPLRRRPTRTRRGKKPSTPSYARMTESTQERIAQTLRSCPSLIKDRTRGSTEKLGEDAPHQSPRHVNEAVSGSTTPRPMLDQSATAAFAFQARLNSFVTDLRTRLQHEFDAEVAQALGERSQLDRQRNVYCGLSDVAPRSASDAPDLSKLKAVSFSPVPVSPEEHVHKAMQSDRMYTKSWSSCGVSPEVGSTSPQPSPSRGALLFSPKRESPIRGQIADALMPSPSSRAEDIDQSSDSDSGHDDGSLMPPPVGTQCSVAAPPPLVFPEEAPSSARACWMADELEEFDAWQKRASAAKIVGTHPLFAAVERKLSAPLLPTDEPARFIDWIAEMNVFAAWVDPLTYNDREKHTTDILHAAIMEACKGIVYDAALAAILS